MTRENYARCIEALNCDRKGSANLSKIQKIWCCYSCKYSIILLTINNYLQFKLHIIKTEFLVIK